MGHKTPREGHMYVAQDTRGAAHARGNYAHLKPIMGHTLVCKGTRYEARERTYPFRGHVQLIQSLSSGTKPAMGAQGTKGGTCQFEVTYRTAHPETSLMGHKASGGGHMYGTQGTRGRAHGAQGTRGAHVRETYNAHLKPIIGHTLVYKGTARHVLLRKINL